MRQTRPAQSARGDWFGHPRGLATLFFSEMWERFSYYGMRGFLILYMSTAAAAGGLGLDTATAAVIYGVYTSSVYLMNIPGGWLADRVLGQRKAVFFGGVLLTLGHLLMAVEEQWRPGRSPRKRYASRGFFDFARPLLRRSGAPEVSFGIR